MTEAFSSATAAGLDRQISENVATVLHRVGMKRQQLAITVGMTPQTMSRRLSGQQPWWMWEVQMVADYFGLSLVEITTDLPSFDEWQARWDELCACRDSNPKPSDLVPALELLPRIPAPVAYLADYRRTA